MTAESEDEHTARREQRDAEWERIEKKLSRQANWLLWTSIVFASIVTFWAIMAAIGMSRAIEALKQIGAR